MSMECPQVCLALQVDILFCYFLGSFPQNWCVRYSLLQHQQLICNLQERTVHCWLCFPISPLPQVRVNQCWIILPLFSPAFSKVASTVWSCHASPTWHGRGRPRAFFVPNGTIFAGNCWIIVFLYGDGWSFDLWIWILIEIVKYWLTL